MLAGTKQFKIFTLDGGGGTSNFGQGKDYFWGTRAITPNDALPGLFMYIKQKYPDLKTVGLDRLGHRRAEQHAIKTDVLKKIAAAGYQFNGLYELFPVEHHRLLGDPDQDQGQRARHPADPACTARTPASSSTRPRP